MIIGFLLCLLKFVLLGHVKMENDVMVNHGRMSGSKRFTPDKPWSNGGADNFMSSNKRQQGDGAELRSGGGRGQDGLHMYSLQTMDGSRGFAEMPKIIPTALARADLFSSNGDFDPSRGTSLVPITEKVITARPVTYVAPMSSIMQRRPHVDAEPFTVATLLNSLGLGKYAIHFEAEEVDMTALRQMGDMDLKELGIPMGPRKKLLLALRPP
ncbi:hypothetical protein CRYUN_Cryun15aG0025600 [Craigia yunnanensis]